MRLRWRGSRPYDELMKKFPNTLISHFGTVCGLPEGQNGNSEVGHMQWVQGESCTWTSRALI